MIYRQPGGITFPPTLLPPSRGIACIVSCGGMERTRQKQREKGEKENRRFILGGKRKKKKRRKERSSFPFEKIFVLSSPVYGIYVCKFEKRRKKKWNDKFRFRSNDHPNELSSAIITANITV